MARHLKLIGKFIAALAVIATVSGYAPASAQQPPSGTNPTAGSVNEDALFRQAPSIGGRVSIPDAKSGVLVQPQGREFRGFHEGSLPWIGGISIVGMLLLLALFYLIKGRIRLEKNEHSGRKIVRFNAFERFTHWMTATCFIVLALTGLNYIFGKRLLMPLMGADAFATMSQLGKYAHNFLSWPFMLGILFMLAVWLKDNIPARVDWAWLKAGGGFFSNTHPSAGRFNAGQKMVFWIVSLGGIAMSITGVLMLFPFATTDIAGMQLTQIVHAVIGVLFIAAILAHIYIGSLGMEGAYDAMGSGKVDLGWAKTHHNLWVAEQQAKTAGGPGVDANARPTMTPAE